MKPRNTRIKVVTKNDGVKTYKVYVAQHQGFLWQWFDFSDHDGYSIVRHTNPYTYFNGGTSLEYAQEHIDKYITAHNKEEAHRKGKDIVNVEYIKYP